MYFIYSISIQLYFNIIPEHTHACLPAWHQFPNYVECASLYLYSQRLTNSHFHFPITVEWRPPNSCFTGPNMMIQNFPQTAAIKHVSNVRTCVLPCGSGVPRGGLGCSNNPPPRNSEGPPKSCQTQPDL